MRGRLVELKQHVTWSFAVRVFRDDKPALAKPLARNLRKQVPRGPGLLAVIMADFAIFVQDGVRRRALLAYHALYLVPIRSICPGGGGVGGGQSGQAQNASKPETEENSETCDQSDERRAGSRCLRDIVWYPSSRERAPGVVPISAEAEDPHAGSSSKAVSCGPWGTLTRS